MIGTIGIIQSNIQNTILEERKKMKYNGIAVNLENQRNRNTLLYAIPFLFYPTWKFQAAQNIKIWTRMQRRWGGGRQNSIDLKLRKKKKFTNDSGEKKKSDKL